MATWRSMRYESTQHVLPDPKVLPALNELAKMLFIGRARQGDERGLTASQLASLGVTHEECHELIAHGLLEARRRFITLTEAGLDLLQEAIPLGAIRPVFDVHSRQLIVAGEIILCLAVQARNRSAFLAAVERTGWSPRIEAPLNGRSAADDVRRIAVTAHYLSAQQSLIDFHADDGAATWNWRRGG